MPRSMRSSRSHRSNASADGACFGIAGPIQGRRARFTNRDWVIDADVLAAQLGGATRDARQRSRGGRQAASTDCRAAISRSCSAGHRCRAACGSIIGAGTGLGIAYASRAATAPDCRERGRPRRLCAAELRQRYSSTRLRRGRRVDAEYVVSGAGLERIYATLRNERPTAKPPALRAELERGPRAAAISRFALDGADPLASEALDLFIDCYGSVAGDHALDRAAVWRRLHRRRHRLENPAATRGGGLRARVRRQG